MNRMDETSNGAEDFMASPSRSSGASRFADVDVPPAPWQLSGSAVLMLCRRGVLALVHYTSSPVGPYNELARAILTWRGPSVVDMPVTTVAAREGGRHIWGFPKRLALLRWQQRGRQVTLSSAGRHWNIRAAGPAFPIKARLWTVQTLGGEPVRVPIRMQGKARLAWNGRRLALWLETFEMTVLPPVQDT